MINEKENPLKEKAFCFALRIIKLYRYLCNEQNEFVLSKQLLRSGTAIGAMQSESEYAESKADFIHKLSIAQKECNESLYWIKLLNHANYINDTMYKSLKIEADELIKILTAIIKTTKLNIKH